MPLGIGGAANRRWQRERYKHDPAYRERKIKAATLRYKRECAADPEFKALALLRSKLSKRRAQIENHERGIRAKQKRIEELREMLPDLAREIAEKADKLRLRSAPLRQGERAANATNQL